jgi:FixJ family two-component response regulator
VVDDDPSVLRALTRLLSAAGLETIAFPSPAAFLQAHDPATPGCLVLDVALPGLDGLELQQALTGSDCARPIVFITGRGDVPTSVRAMKGGAVDFLTKPVNDTSCSKRSARPSRWTGSHVRRGSSWTRCDDVWPP